MGELVSGGGGSGGRRVAFEVLLRVLRGGAWSGLALDAALKERPNLDPRERALATELVYGSLRRTLALDAVIEAKASRPISEMDDRVLILLRLGAYQLLHMRVPDHAAVSETVELTGEVGAGGAKGFVNGILRALAASAPIEPPTLVADPRKRLLLTEALPPWIFDGLAEDLPVEEVEELARAFNQAAPTTLRAPSPAARDAAVSEFSDLGVGARVTGLSALGLVIDSFGHHPEALPGWEKLKLQAQDEGAQIVGTYALLPSNSGRLMDEPPKMILDACAGPGGKTCHLAQALPEAKLEAVDLHRRRADRVGEEAERLGLGGRVETHAADATKPLPFADRRSFDLILIDAPCTGLGTLRRHPEIKLTRTSEDVLRLADLQRRLLSSLSAYLAPGGRMVYAVCTTTRAEGPEMVDRFLEDHSDFERDPPSTGPDETRGAAWSEGLLANGDLRLWTHRHGTDCFYAARLRRRLEGDKAKQQS